MDVFFDTMKAAGAAGFAAVVLAVILSCSQASVEAEQKWLTFHCPDGQVVMAQFQPQDQFVNVRFAGRELSLPHVISGSGARYSDGKTTFWNRGKSVLMQVDDKIVVQDCMLQGEPKRLAVSMVRPREGAMNRASTLGEIIRTYKAASTRMIRQTAAS